MRRSPKPAKSKVEARPPVARKSAKSDDARLRDLEKRLAESLKREAEALEQQAATAEILKVISQSPNDMQPVFDSILEHGMRLCDAALGTVGLYDGRYYRHVAQRGGSPEYAEWLFSGPFEPGPESTLGRMIATRQPFDAADYRELPEYRERRPRAVATVELGGARTYLAVPMLKDGRVIGGITIRRAEVRPFTEKQIDLVSTFADQAVIAIENVRLFKELEARNRDLTEALDRQTATSEILRVIASSPTDLQPVFTSIAESAVRLCEGLYADVSTFDGQMLKYVAFHNVSPAAVAMLQQRFPSQPTRGGSSGRAVLDRAVVHIPDVSTDPEYEFSDIASTANYRALLAVPMLREGRAIGAINVARAEVGAFSEKQIELLKTFADQAVIAIENVRLFTELQEKNRALTEAHAQVTESLERQTATSEILRVISQSPTDVQPVFDAIVRSGAALCHASDVIILMADGDSLRIAASVGSVASSVRKSQFFQGGGLPLTRGSVSGRAFIDRRTVHVPDVSAMPDDEFPEGKRLQQEYGGRGTTLAAPLLRDDVSLGVITLVRNEVRPFTDQQVALLETFADQAVIAIENVRLFNETKEALEQQTATGEILKVISSSPTDLQPVFETIVRHAVTLCEAREGGAFRFDGQRLHLVASTDWPGADAIRQLYPRRPDRETVAGRAVLEKASIQVEDFEADLHISEANRRALITSGLRSALGVPMMQHGEVIGTISVNKETAGRFPDEHVALLKTFADQAVIAIENVRLFTELQARTQELTRSVGQLTALGEVGRAVSSTLDLETVLSTIVSRAIQLSGTDGGSVYEYDEATEEFSLRASRNLPEAYVEQVLDTRPRKGEGAVGRVAQTREPVQIADISDAAAYESRVRNMLLQIGLRALLAVPLIAEDQLVGALIVMRKRTGTFAAEEVALLQTFATQSALAIQNARLFREIEDKSRQLEVASQHKSEFLANMSHELRTPLNAIIGFSEVLSERMFGELNEKQEEYLKDIYASGTHLLSLINDILDLSKIEAGRMELELTDFHLPTALDSALTLVRERAGRRGIALHMNVDSRLGQIQADERKVRQVVLNLLSNAIKFTPEGGRIEVGAAPKGGFVEVSISDTGVGIAPEDQEAIFEEFRQVGTAEKKVEGTGLGLTLCRKFIELHGGRIWVKSQVGVGSTFTFTIPVRSGK